MAKRTEEIKAYYGGIAREVSNSGCSCSGTQLYSPEELKGLPKEAVMASLGCANPIALANLKEGETVLDLGSGGGIDVLISAKYVGESGKVYGLDMTDEMLELAEKNRIRNGAKNVQFLKGQIEEIPLADGVIDVITSNCVINLSERKADALREAFRVLREGGRFAISDIVQMRPVPDGVKENLEMWLGCIAGALTPAEYEEILREVGFSQIEIIPVNVYTQEFVREMAKAKGLADWFLTIDGESIDGAFAGAQIKAYKAGGVLVDEMRPSDWPHVAAIYLEGIQSGLSTFQQEVPSWSEWDAGHTKTCRLVARMGDQVVGWAALTPVSGRCVYRGVAEVSLYVAGEYRGRGIGSALLQELIGRSEDEGFWTLQAGIISENTPSLRLHRKCGFREIGYRERLGQMEDGKWHDIVLMEKRSMRVGL